MTLIILNVLVYIFIVLYSVKVATVKILLNATWRLTDARILKYHLLTICPT